MGSRPERQVVGDIENKRYRSQEIIVNDVSTLAGAGLLTPNLEVWYSLTYHRSGI